MKYEIPCIIFAGGKSKRMGEDKALLPFSNYKTLTQYQYERFRPFFKKVYISTKNINKFDFKAPFIEDTKNFKEYSPLIALISVFKNLEDSHIFVLSVDSPFFSIKDFEKLYKNIDKNYDAVISKDKEGNIHPLCGIYKRSIIKLLEKSAIQKRYKLKDILKEANTLYIEFDNNKSFINLNYPEEYQNAQRIVNG